VQTTVLSLVRRGAGGGVEAATSEVVSPALSLSYSRETPRRATDVAPSRRNRANQPATTILNPADNFGLILFPKKVRPLLCGVSQFSQKE